MVISTHSDVKISNTIHSPFSRFYLHSKQINCNNNEREISFFSIFIILCSRWQQECPLSDIALRSFHRQFKHTRTTELINSSCNLFAETTFKTAGLSRSRFLFSDEVIVNYRGTRYAYMLQVIILIYVYYIDSNKSSYSLIMAIIP